VSSGEQAFNLGSLQDIRVLIKRRWGKIGQLAPVLVPASAVVPEPP
jgi:hypothetical protein